MKLAIRRVIKKEDLQESFDSLTRTEKVEGRIERDGIQICSITKCSDICIKIYVNQPELKSVIDIVKDYFP